MAKPQAAAAGTPPAAPASVSEPTSPPEATAGVDPLAAIDDAETSDASPPAATPETETSSDVTVSEERAPIALQEGEMEITPTVCVQFADRVAPAWEPLAIERSEGERLVRLGLAIDPNAPAKVG